MFILDLFDDFINLGSVVVLPIFIFIFGLILGAKPGKALISGLKVGIGFIGVNLVIGLLGSTLGAAAQELVTNFGFQLDVLDVGWPASAAIAFGTDVGALAIPVGIVVNIVLIVFGLTKTLDIDLWNFWHAAFVSSITFIITGSFVLAIYANIVYMMFILFLGDILAKRIQKFYGFPGITFPHGTSAPSYFFALPLNKFFDWIGLGKINASPEGLQKKIGVFGDITVIGVIIGIVVGILAYGIGASGYDEIYAATGKILNLAINTGAVMFLMPKMVAVLMEGLIPISEAAQKFVQKKFNGREIFIGMDSALSVGHPAVLSSSLILIPITIFLAMILPGNKVLPFGDLATLPFLVCLMAIAFNGNLIKTILGGSIYISLILYVATWAAPFITQMAANAGFDVAAGQTISSLVDGGVYTTFLFGYAAQTNAWIGLTVMFVLTLGGLIFVNKRKKKSEVTE